MDWLLEAMINRIAGSSLFDGMIGILTKDPFTDYGRGVARIVESLYDAVMSAAIMLIFIYFLIAVVDKMTSENFTWEQLWKQMAMLLAAKMVVEHGLEIMQLMSQVGVEMVTIVQGEGLGSLNQALDAKTVISNFKNGLTSSILKILSDILLLLYLALPWVLSWIMSLCVKIICYTRLIEIYIRACFAPLALSDFFKNGFQGGGWRYLKSFFAVCLQGAVILAIAVIYSKLLGSFLSIPDDKNLFEFSGISLAVGASAVMLMFRSLSICKEIMGAN